MKTKKKTLKQKLKSQKRKKKAKDKDVYSAFEKSNLNWVSIGDDWCLSVMKDVDAWIIKLSTNYAIILYNTIEPYDIKLLMSESVIIPKAIAVCEAVIGNSFENNPLIRLFCYKNAKWRVGPSSKSQKYLLKTGGVSFSNDISKGDACNLLTKLFSVAPKITDDYFGELCADEKAYFSEDVEVIPPRESMIGKDHYSEFALTEEFRQKNEKIMDKINLTVDPLFEIFEPNTNQRKGRQMMEKLDIWSKEEIEHIFKLQLQYASTSTKNTMKSDKI